MRWSVEFDSRQGLRVWAISKGDLMTMSDYGEVIRKALTADNRRAEKHGKSLAGRVFHIALFSEALKACAEARARGATLTFNEWSSSDRFDLSTNGRTVSYELTRGEALVTLRRDAFPPSLVPGEQQTVPVPAPLNMADAMEQARRLISDALSLLFRE